MSDKDLIAEAREACADKLFNGTYEAGLVRRLADALEARQTSENDYEALRIAVSRVVRDVMNFPQAVQARLLGQNMWPLRDALVDSVLEAGFSRAAAPDAATDLRAERDAALAAIERVRASHTPTLPGYGPKSCVHDGRAWPCPTVAALDGAPEPEEKP